MPSLPREIADFMATHGIVSDEVWKIPQGNAYAIKHKALERVAAKVGITYEMPKVLEADGNERCVAICVAGTLGERSEWSIGEASPHNYRISGKMAAYPYAMAEKRAKDRVILKLLQMHGALYSEEEIDGDKRENPHVTRPTDIVPDIEYDEQGQPVDNIPNGDPGIERLPKSKARADFEAAQKEMQATVTIKQLETWGANNANRIDSFPSDWAQIMRGLYVEHRDALRGKVAA